MDGYSAYLDSPLDRFRLPGLGGRPQSLVPDPNTFADAAGVAGDADSSYLGGLMESSLGGLAYVGKLLDKYSGARAVRGAIGGLSTGNFRDVASILPFSDALGITRESDAVQGTDITDQIGLTSATDDGFGRQALGFGAEVLLDPSTYLTFGAKTAAGAALKGSQLAPDLASGIRAGQRSLVGVGLPFQQPIANFGTGELAAKAAEFAPLELAGKGVEKLTGGYVNPYTFGQRVLEPVKRYGRTLFDTDVAGATTRLGQTIAEDIYTPSLKYGADLNTIGNVDNIIGGTIGADREVASYIGDVIDPLRPVQGQADQVLRGLRYQAEGFDNEAMRALQAAGLSPQDAAAVAARTQDLAQSVRDVLPRKQSLGISSAQLDDEYAKYFPRESNPVRVGDGTVADWFRNRATGFSTVDDASKARDAVLKNIPGGTNTINDLFADPALRGMSDLELAAELRRKFTGTESPPDDSIWWDQSKALADRILGSSAAYLPQSAGGKGTKFFNDDVATQAAKGLKGEAKTVASAKAVYGLLDKKYGAVAPVAEFERAGKAYRTIDEVLKDAKLTLEAEGTPGRLVSQFIAAEKLGIDASKPKNLDALKNLAVPEDVANDILKLGRAWQSPKELAPVIAAWDWATNLFKSSVTTLFPAFHTRNGVSALFNMWRDDALSLPAMRDGVSLLRGGEVTSKIPGLENLPPDQLAKELVKEMVGNKVAFVNESRISGDLATQPGGGTIFKTNFPEVGGQKRSLYDDIKGFIGGFVPEKGKVGEQLNPLNQQGVNRDTDEFIPVKQGRKVGTAIEDFARSSHYIALRSQGVDAANAAQRVKKYHIDYGDLTEAERSVAKRVFPWYCMPIDHEILTRDGFKFYDQISVGDEVLSMTQDRKMVWTPVLDIAEFDYDGPLHVYESRGAGFECTPNHKWGAVSHADQLFSLRESKDITTNHKIVMNGEFEGDTSILSQRHAAILGWVVTDGHIRWVGNCCEMVVYQSEKKFANELRSLLGVEPRQATDDRQPHKVYTFAVSPTDRDAISSVIQRREQLPEVVTHLSRKAAEAMYDAMMMAEGCKSGVGQEHFAQTAKNWHVRDAFQILCMMTGRMAFQSKMGLYIRKKTHLDPKSWRKPDVHYTGKIWCPSTKHGTWVVRHAGAVSVTGNTFSRKSLPPLLEDLVTKPSKITAATRLVSGVREPGEFVPEYVGEGASIPVPGAPDGQQRYISGFGLPIEDEAIKTLGSVARGDFQRAAQQVFGMAQPWLKTPAEIASGVQFYSGRRLEDLRPYESIAGLGLLPEDRARQLSQIIANTPASRAFSSLDKLLDERKGAGATAVNLLTGARLTDVDVAKQQDIATRELLKDLLRGQSGVRSREDVYVPKDKIGLLDPYELQLYANLKATEQRVRKRNEQQK